MDRRTFRTFLSSLFASAALAVAKVYAPGAAVHGLTFKGVPILLDNPIGTIKVLGFSVEGRPYSMRIRDIDLSELQRVRLTGSR